MITRRLISWRGLLLGAIANFGLLHPCAYAAPVYTAQATPSQLTAILDGPGLRISNLAITHGVNEQYGIFTGAESLLGIPDGVFMNTGHLKSLLAPNNASAYAFNTKTIYLDKDLATISSTAKYDPAIIEFDIVPQGDRANFVFSFGSEEYPEYVCSKFNDAFGLFVSGEGLTATHNAAYLPDKNVSIAVNNINDGYAGAKADGTTCDLGNAVYFINNGNGSGSNTLQLDGYSKPITASLSGLIAGKTYHVKLALADAGDPGYDSGAFFKWLTSTDSKTVDLALTGTASSTTPAYDTPFTLTYTVNNTSTLATSGVQVAISLPAGITWISDDSNGTFNPTSNNWLIGDIPAQSSKTLKLAVKAGVSANYTIPAEITYAFNEDPDSTPFNRTSFPKEDDTAIITLKAMDNIPPRITSNGGGTTASMTLAENKTAITTVTALDDNADPLTYGISGGDDKDWFNLNRDTGKLTFKTAPNFEQPQDTDKNNTYKVEVSVSDGVHTTKQLITVTVTDTFENSPPKMTSHDGKTAVSLSLGENNPTITTFSATDPDNDKLTFRIGKQDDADLFQINTNTGQLAFIKSPDFETPKDTNSDNVYTLTVYVSDGYEEVSQQVFVTITDVFENRPPVITSNAGQPLVSIEVEENKTTVATITATDSDQNPLVYSIIGGTDSERFTIDATKGTLSFVNTPDFEAPNDGNLDNLYIVRIQVTDGFEPVTQTFNIQVMDVEDTPTVRVKARTYLQGAYQLDETLMKNALHQLNFLPTTQPYFDVATALGFANAAEVSLSFNYTGNETASAAVMNATGKDEPVDWVLVELRGVTEVNKRYGIMAAILQRDGDIVDAKTGSPEIDIRNVKEGLYYVVVRHRNHLAVMTGTALYLKQTTATTVDFTLPKTATYGGKFSRFEYGNLAMMWAGDVNNSNSIISSGPGSDSGIILAAVLLEEKNTDANAAFQLKGYASTDLNMDGTTLYSGPDNDTNLLLGNILLYPGNTNFSGNFVIQGGAPR